MELSRTFSDVSLKRKKTMKKQSFVLERFLLVLIAVVATMFGGIVLAYDGQGEVVVETSYGQVKGYQGQENTLVWKGIPFAQPPVGDLRWQAPKDPEPWHGVLKTQQFSNACPQFSATGSVVGNEDCLYLNIWRPASHQAGLPVYFWIHGGGNTTGSAAIPYYDGTMIASKSNMVVVSIQYRLGVLGWFTNPALRTQEHPFSASGNYGTLDIIKALEWVRENIEAFGGDPHNVTIAGESAGAFNVLSLLISDPAGGLFDKAISESGGMVWPFTGFQFNVPLSAGDTYSTQVLANLTIPAGEPVADYLRSLTVQELYAALPGTSPSQLFFGMFFFPCIFTDGVVINAKGVDALDDTRSYNQVPLMIGTNLEEYKFFLFPFFSTFPSADDYQLTAMADSDLWKLAGVDSIANKICAHHTQPGVYAYQLLYGKPPEYYPQFVDYSAWPRDYYGMDLALLYGAFHT